MPPHILLQVGFLGRKTRVKLANWRAFGGRLLFLGSDAKPLAIQAHLKKEFGIRFTSSKSESGGQERRAEQ